MARSGWKSPSAAVAALALAAGACATTTTGVGTGDLSGNPNGPPVFLYWTSSDGGQSGTMTATLPDGSVHAGPFFQIRSTAEATQFGPLWDGWAPGWPDWAYWGPTWGLGPEQAFVTRYSGKVVANLSSTGGTGQMRCRFHLMHPTEGMTGGGQGECQLRGGKTLYATFAGR